MTPARACSKAPRGRSGAARGGRRGPQTRRHPATVRTTMPGCGPVRSYYSARAEPDPTPTMRARELVLFLGAGLLLAAAGVALFGNPSSAGELKPPSPTVDENRQPDHTEPEVGGPAAIVEAPLARPSDVATVDPVHRKSDDVAPADATSGRIMGDIPLTASIVDKIQSISVYIDELKSLTIPGSSAIRKVVQVELGIGTPTFDIGGIPFSDYGYVVRVHSPGLNGGQRTLQLTKDHPLVDDIKLPITPGCPFSLVLRDQDMQYVGMTAVQMIPKGEPYGRTRFDGTTDNYGSVAFNDVLAGDYEVHIGPASAPLCPPQLVTVQPGLIMVQNGVVRPQGVVLSVPRGMPLKVVVIGFDGYPIQGCTVRVEAADRLVRFELEGETDWNGAAEFSHLQAGRWQVTVEKEGFERRDRFVTIKDGETPADLRIPMPRRL